MPERSMRQRPLDRDPQITSASMQDLFGMAHAIEEQAGQRYAALAELMQRRGEDTTAAAFRVLLEQARQSGANVEQRAQALGVAIEPAIRFASQLSRELPDNWGEITGSALLTPYRVHALAVQERQRIFAFFSYLAARAGDPSVASEAEALAAAALRDASSLRTHRRQAWPGESRPMQLPDLKVSSRAALHEVITQHETAIERHLGALAFRLRALGDEESARVLEQNMRLAPGAITAARDAGIVDNAANPNEDHVARGRESIAEGGDDARALIAAWAEGEPPDTNAPETPARLLLEARKPLEAFSETLESILHTSEGALFDQASTAMSDVIARIARVSAQAAKRTPDAHEAGA